jgi:TIR domain
MAGLTTNFTAPLNIYVVWHPDYSAGQVYFRSIFNLLCRKTDQPLQRGIEIPVYPRSSCGETGNFPPPIEFREADRNFIILLVDDSMFIDKSWRNYVKNLLSPTKNYTFLPVALTSNAFKMMEELKKPHFLRLYEMQDNNEEDLYTRRFHQLSIALMQKLTNYLRSETGDDKNSAKKVQLFISHAKADGKEVAYKFVKYIRDNYTLSTFFDTTDMPYGEDFPEHVKHELKDGIVVVFHTDMYASREWCMNEVLWAKRYMTPVLVINCLQNNEPRSFPYMGNGPVIRLKKSKRKYNEIVHEALFLILKNLHAQHQISKYKQLYWNKDEQPLQFGNTPELLHFESIQQYLKNKDITSVTVIYPDPPLGYEENILLNNVNDKIIFLTPLTLFKKS